MPVDPERVQAVFLAAEQESVASRAAILERLCGENVELRERVETLLRAHEASGSFLESPSPQLVATVDEPIHERPGTTIGPYRLLEQIGEGGFGVVFMAEQTEPVRRKVALKILKPGMDTRQVVARFEAERQALAIMDHPNIAKVFDGGVVRQVSKPADSDDRIGILSHSGRPYFVMELVKGVPITDYCDLNHLTPWQRLELFIPVCQAVQHAHQKGIIHRDLKPSNVLVTVHDTRPVPKVIDFGVAKALGQELTDKTLFTGFAQMVGTPLYMSPEQAGQSGLDIDTRSDIYSLGVMLYELLSGSTPFDKNRFKKAAYDEIRRIIREEDPPKPSTKLSKLNGLHASDAKGNRNAPTTLASIAANRGTEPGRLTKLVRGELDWIVMKCLEKDRNRRYETANGLAMDVQRFLADEPVQAGPPSAWYRFRKFARRNKGKLAAGAAGVVVLLLALAGLALNSWLVTRERDEKEKALTKAVAEKERADQNLVRAREAVQHYLTRAAQHRLLKEADFHKLRRELLESALPFYQDFVKQRSEDFDLEADRARAYGDLALLREELGDMDSALAAHEERRNIFERLSRHFPASPVYRAEVATSWMNTGNVHRALSRPEQAEAAYRQARSKWEPLRSEYPTFAPYRQEQAGVDHNLAVLLRTLGRTQEAASLLEQTIATRQLLVSDFPAEPKYRSELAQSRSSLGNVLHDLGRLDDALDSLQLAGNMMRALAEEFPSTAEYREIWAMILNNQSVMFCELGRLDAGLTAQREALRLEERLAADFPNLPGYREAAAQSANNIGVVLKELRRYEQALAAYDQALEKANRLVKEFPSSFIYREIQALAHGNRGEALTKLARSEEALAAYREARSIQERLVSQSPDVLRPRQHLGMCCHNLGEVLGEMGRFEAAAEAFDKALTIRERLCSEFPAVVPFALDLGATYGGIANLHRHRGQSGTALDWFDKALARLTPILAADPRLFQAKGYIYTVYINRAMALDDLGRHAEALANWDQARTLDEGQNLDFRLRRARTLALLGRHAEAVAEADVVAKMPDGAVDLIHAAACVYALAATAARDDALRAEPYAVRAVALLRQAFTKADMVIGEPAAHQDLDVLRARKDFQDLLKEFKPKSTR